MNYLAHLLLSGDEEDLMIGNFVADFIKNKDLPHFTEGVQKGIFYTERLMRLRILTRL